MKVIPYLIYFFLVGAHMVIFKDLTSIYEVTFNIPVLVVLLVALYKEDIPAIWFGFFVGLVMAAGGPPDHLIWQALLMSLLVVVACYVRIRLNLDSFNAKLLFVLGGVGLHNLIGLVFTGFDGLGYYLLTDVVGGAVYTTAVAWLFFMIKERRLTVARVRALF